MAAYPTLNPYAPGRPSLLCIMLALNGFFSVPMFGQEVLTSTSYDEVAMNRVVVVALALFVLSFAFSSFSAQPRN
jgi:hypothetical protein